MEINYSYPSQKDDKSKKAVLKKAVVILLIVILTAIGFFSGMYAAQKNEIAKQLAQKEVVLLGKVTNKYSGAPEGKIAQDVDFNLFWQVWDKLEEKYVDKDKLNDKEMFYGAIKGMVAAVGDPYTVFMNPVIAQEFSDDLAGTFEGIGAEIGIRNDILTIIAPLQDMPAEKAGLMAGDKVYAIDGVSTAGITADEAVQKIRGPHGTEVTLTISRDGIEKAKDVKIKRDVIIVKSVKTQARKDNIFVLTITNFNDDTIDLFSKAVNDIINKNPKGIILDLRNNPGGYLDTAVEIASEWVEEGVIVSEKFSDDRKDDYLARGRARLKDFSTIVLVNQGSASASEIVAGALQDAKKARIVGKQTFGKGSVQTLDELPDGSSVKITVAKWLTPNGNCINETGIKPDVEIDLTEEDYNAGKDPQMDKAAEILNAEK